MNVEVINTGTELLLGNVVNSHLAFFGRELFPLGLRVSRQVTVPDGDAIRHALETSLRSAEIILVTGGLGPTTDDITREITAELFGLELVENADVLQAIAERFARRGIVMTERVKRQAQVPRGATVLPNLHGTAPGLYVKAERNGTRHVFLLPGPPRELKPMFASFALPVLKALMPERAEFSMRSYRVVGMGESNVEAEIGERVLAIPGLELGYCARAGEVDVRCIGTAQMLDAAEAIILAKLGSHIASRDNRPVEQTVVENLAAKNKTLAIAESCTGGLIAHRVTNVPGASAVFFLGFVTYANSAKSAELGVDIGLLKAHGAVSREVAAAMAEGALRAGGTDFALSTTGVAGPGGGSAEKPVGTVFIGIAARSGETKVTQHFFPTDRENFKQLASQAALDLLRRAL